MDVYEQIQDKIRIRNRVHELENALWDKFAMQRDNGVAEDHPEQVALHQRIIALQQRYRAINNVMECIVRSIPREELREIQREVSSEMYKIISDMEKAMRFKRHVAFVLKDCLHCDSFEHVYASKRCHDPPICGSFD